MSLDGHYSRGPVKLKDACSANYHTWRADKLNICRWSKEKSQQEEQVGRGWRRRVTINWRAFQCQTYDGHSLVVHCHTEEVDHLICTKGHHLVKHTVPTVSSVHLMSQELRCRRTINLFDFLLWRWWQSVEEDLVIEWKLDCHVIGKDVTVDLLPYSRRTINGNHNVAL